MRYGLLPGMAYWLRAAHAVYGLAPVLLLVFVIDPATHSLHAVDQSAVVCSRPDVHTHEIYTSALDLFKYRTTAQAVHIVAPALLPMPVIEPAGHAMNDTTPGCVEYTRQLHTQCPCLRLKWRPCW
jgi:hypothetical protein